MRETIHNYKEAVVKVIENINERSVGSAVYALKKAREKNQRVYVVGNGGSAAVASHFACNLAIHAVTKNDKTFKVISLSESVPMITARAMEFGYEDVYRSQLANIIEANDVLFAISINGNDLNIISAANIARSKNAVVIGLTGSTGGKLRELSDVCVNIDCDDSDITSDAHMVICHMLVHWFKENLPA